MKEVIIIGAGFSGLCMAIKLRQAGIDDFIILERNTHFGGTWYDNSYPGAACDVESHLYSFSFEPNPNWSRQFSPQQEILSYIEHCVAKYNLAPHIQFHNTVLSAVFDEQSGIWTVTTADNKTFLSRIVISCSGVLSEPAYPNIKGLKNFKGKLFHTARWDKSIDLNHKKVAVIGTGASAIQIVPAIAPLVSNLFLFQRTPPWILPKPDKVISDFRLNLYRHVPLMARLYRIRLYWTHELLAIGFVVKPAVMKWIGKFALSYLHRKVKDETLRQKLTPDYTIGCKRILLSKNYYPALQRANVEVVTTGIQEITETGISTSAQNYEVDIIVLATGFKAAEGVSMEVRGLGGIDLNHEWRDGASAYLGTSVAGFPNLYLVVGPNTGLGHSSMLLMIEAQVKYIIAAIKAMNGAKYSSVKKAVQESYNNTLQNDLQNTIWQKGGCRSWYQTASGKNVTLWAGFTFTFMRQLKNFEIQKYEVVN